MKDTQINTSNLWEKNLKQIIPVYNINFEKQMINIKSAWRMFNEIELMQYTGLKDKNGKEIYEGDILSRKKWGLGGYHEDEERYLVESLDYYLDSGEVDYHFGVHLWNEYCEVIGNIYENPELISA
jgi:uncharacterized phage protein (TIGR01671 family)